MDSKKTKRLIHEEVKKQLIESMVVSVFVETDELKKKAEKIQDPEEAASIIKEYEDIMRIKKKGIINIAFHQARFLKDLRTKKSSSN